jgi:hypothetical protein
MQTQYDTDVLRWIDLSGESSLREVEKQIHAARSSLMQQIDTLESTLARADVEEERELRHLATVVEHTAHLMHETVDLLQVRRALMSAENTVTLRVSGMDLRVV